MDQYELLGTVPASAGVVYEGDDVRWYSYVDLDVTNGITYYYAVNAYNQYGESELSKIDANGYSADPKGSPLLRDFHSSRIAQVSISAELG